MLMAMAGETVKKTPGSPVVGGATLPVNCGPLGAKLSSGVVNLTSNRRSIQASVCRPKGSKRDLR